MACLPPCLSPILSIGVPTFVNEPSVTPLSRMSPSVLTTPFYACIPPHQLSMPGVIKPTLILITCKRSTALAQPQPEPEQQAGDNGSEDALLLQVEVHRDGQARHPARQQVHTSNQDPTPGTEP